MIKSKELMLGDWVSVKTALGERITTVQELYQTGIITKEGGPFLHDEISPIPLTHDVLHKNEITLIAVGDDGVLTPKKDRNRFEKWLIHTRWKDAFLWYDRLTKRWSFHGLNGRTFTYVHQLQHALSFAEIEKEIVL